VAALGVRVVDRGGEPVEQVAALRGEVRPGQRVGDVARRPREADPQAIAGVLCVEWTRESTFDPGRRSSRAIPKASRITFAWIESRQTKIAAATTSRYVVANAFEKFASITWAGSRAPLTPADRFAGEAGTSLVVRLRRVCGGGRGVVRHGDGLQG